ncbi:hypothetical protein P0R31_10895 [Bradyrhizobium yuanmingense]|uniref:hypothetical protein n=1 Tax=Bradyrhizobium yuanmingense TaxID=108015 RepID=UPI0023B920E4|nr:hypothetical protein [Bradyrhizobium yuanmingense]MDF0517739.1 hypothetical protein [Bradyrhizobium yuanmingense]
MSYEMVKDAANQVRIGSMAIDKEASRIWRGQIRDILNQQWDPIGGCPADEYDGYVGTIAAMVRDNATDEALMKYLEWASPSTWALAGLIPSALGRSSRQ